jgi:Holliday junction resolvase
MWDEFKGLGTKSELEKILWTEGFEVVRQHQGGHDE